MLFKIFRNISLFFLLFSSLAIANDTSTSNPISLADIDCPNQFHIKQDPTLRVFHVFEDDNYFGCVVNSGYGELDFYDSKKEKKYGNIRDDLYDDFGRIGSVKFLSDFDWYYWLTRPARIELFSKKNMLLATLRAEGDNYSFVFRDAETNKALAIAILNWIPTKNSYFYEYYIQDWSVFIVDRERLEEKKILSVYLIWALLKHSQTKMPSPNDIKYEHEPPDYPNFQVKGI